MKNLDLFNIGSNLGKDSEKEKTLTKERIIRTRAQTEMHFS